MLIDFTRNENNAIIYKSDGKFRDSKKCSTFIVLKCFKNEH